ncbi:MAG: hypothetical protein ACXAEU_13395 [Candidatus Hodarchaeales archaeon]|jgi:hypothetical protein
MVENHDSSKLRRRPFRVISGNLASPENIEVTRARNGITADK